MRKPIFTLATVLMLTLSLAVNASAASYVADDITYQNLNGQQLAIKVYTLLPEQNPDDLVEEDFEYDGYLYSYSSMTKEEQTYSEENLHTETVTITTSSQNMEDILAALEPTIEYVDGEVTGTLALDHSTIDTQVAGYKNNSYTVSATKNYTGLDRNDSSYIDKTVVKDGRTLSLSNISWSVESTTLVGDELIPASYSATATYTGTAYSQTATGYITTADYVGTISVSGISSIRYTVTYVGTQIVTEPEPTPMNPLFIAIPAALLLIAVSVLLLLLLMRKNCTVYAATGKGNEYDKCGRLLLRTKHPELRIDRLKNVPEGIIAVEVEAATARKLFGQTISIQYFDETFTHTVGNANGPYWFKVDVGSVPEDDPLGKEEEPT